MEGWSDKFEIGRSGVANHGETGTRGDVQVIDLIHEIFNKL
jgi:hypothetical protein